MLKHIVMYKLKDSSAEQRQKLKEVFVSMQGKIDVLRAVESGVDILNTARSFDVVLICTFDSARDLQIYSDHPVHQKVKDYVQSVVEKAVAVDFEC